MKKAMMVLLSILGFMVIFPTTFLVEMNLAPVLPTILKEVYNLSGL